MEEESTQVTEVPSCNNHAALTYLHHASLLWQVNVSLKVDVARQGVVENVDAGQARVHFKLGAW